MLERMHREVTEIGRNAAGAEIVGFVIVAVVRDRGGELHAARADGLPSSGFERSEVHEAITAALEADL